MCGFELTAKNRKELVSLLDYITTTSNIYSDPDTLKVFGAGAMTRVAWMENMTKTHVPYDSLL